MKLSDYEPIVGKNVIEELSSLARRLSGKLIRNINSTAVGGGVAEILHRLIPLLNELGLRAHWSVIKGGEKFFSVTKKFHNMLHGKESELSQAEIELFLQTAEENLKNMDISGDIIFVHDPQPIVLIKKKSILKRSRWIWRCHIDVSQPNAQIWNFLRPYIEQYDASVFSSPSFAHSLKIRQFLISPSIDPLSDKNKELSQETIDAVLNKFGITHDKPIISQISRFDYLKDPLGVIDVYRLVKKYIDCQLVLAGGTASDDPESNKVLAEVLEKAKGDPDIHILALPAASDIEINALQRAADVILQKSIREGFALTVTEALWKAKPVVASAVGGIPSQIKHRFSGLLSRTIEGTAYGIKQLLNSPEYAKSLGQIGREHIRQNFLLTRHLRDYLLLFLALYHKKDIVNI
ncbi:MAG: glycosyltransferase [Candidatus Omnitrophica bacterium]|nr:glycosyltransferase [Candidatus Omnitrophota bacterium]